MLTLKQPHLCASRLPKSKKLRKTHLVKRFKLPNPPKPQSSNRLPKKRSRPSLYRKTTASSKKRPARNLSSPMLKRKFLTLFVARDSNQLMT
jgi:hypothetical protein